MDPLSWHLPSVTGQSVAVKRAGLLAGEDGQATRRSRGCLAAALLAAVVLAGVGAGGVVWLKRHFDPPPVRVVTEPQALRPWPRPLDPVAERAIVGSPRTSVETSPPIERLYILLQGHGLDAEQVAELASAHLSSLGWRMEPQLREWFVFRGDHPESSDGSVYVGPLRDYIDDSRWTTGDGEAADVLLRLARGHRGDQVVVQIFAGYGDRD